MSQCARCLALHDPDLWPTCPRCGELANVLPVPDMQVTRPCMPDREIFARLLASALVGNDSDLASYRAREAMAELDALYPAQKEQSDGSR